MNRFGRISSGVIFVLLLTCNNTLAAIGSEVTKTSAAVSFNHVLNWTLGLFVVLGLFFLFIWIMKRTGALPTQSLGGMRVISGLTLGMREKLILVEVGEKQLVLAVTPGKIENLCLLEGEDRVKQQPSPQTSAAEFSDKLKHYIAGAKGD